MTITASFFETIVQKKFRSRSAVEYETHFSCFSDWQLLSVCWMCWRRQSLWRNVRCAFWSILSFLPISMAFFVVESSAHICSQINWSRLGGRETARPLTETQSDGIFFPATTGSEQHQENERIFAFEIASSKRTWTKFSAFSGPALTFTWINSSYTEEDRWAFCSNAWKRVFVQRKGSFFWQTAFCCFLFVGTIFTKICQVLQEKILSLLPLSTFSPLISTILRW